MPRSGVEQSDGGIIAVRTDRSADNGRKKQAALSEETLEQVKKKQRQDANPIEGAPPAKKWRKCKYCLCSCEPKFKSASTLEMPKEK